jgi:N-methylhydantoinase A
MSTRVAVDIGGTFTDVVGFDDVTRKVVVGKTLSTPRDLLDGIVNGLNAAAIPLDEPEAIVHGSTVVINALIERKGARTAVVTTRGFRDIYEMGRINRPDAFNLEFEQHRPLVPRELMFEVTERLRADGSVYVAFDEDNARTVARSLVKAGVEAVGVVFLHGYRNPEHEIAMGRILAEEAPGMYVSLSHELTREYREFERTSTTAANAFVGPVVNNYIGRLESLLQDAGNDGTLAIMQSNGGLADSGTIRRQAIQMMESGPAGGVVGAIELCRDLGYRDAIAFDMGGTTAKASVIRDLTFPNAAEYFVGGYVRGLPIRIPCLDIVEVGTGGGSIAWTDAAGGMHVGPRSAGAEPGPACYGQGGTDATVTDAAVVLGILSPAGKLSGGLQLDGAAARKAVGALGERVDLNAEESASGILAIAAASMANAVRAVTTERGLDPRDFALVAYGGNGPLHISLVARELGITRVVIPAEPAVFSALGMLMADIRRDVVLTDIRILDTIDAAVLESDLRALEVSAEEVIRGGGIDFRELSFLRAADMRYVGQEHSLTLPIPDILVSGGLDHLKKAFDDAHLERFGHSAPQERAEIVSLRVSAVGGIDRPGFAAVPQGSEEPEPEAFIGSREVVFGYRESAQECRIFRRSELRAGNKILGPAAIEESTTTTFIRPGDALEVDAQGNLLLTIGTVR